MSLSNRQAYIDISSPMSLFPPERISIKLHAYTMPRMRVTCGLKTYLIKA